MRRCLTLAAFFLIISLAPVCAQRSARSGGGSHGGFSGSRGGFSGHAGFVGHRSGGQGMGGAHVAGAHTYSRITSHAGSGVGFRGDHFRGRGSDRSFRHRCFGCGYGFRNGYGYPYYSYYDPFWDSWWWDSHSSYDEDAARERQIASEMNAENLEEQRMLRDEEQDHDQDAYARPSHSLSASRTREEERAQNDPATVLVFRDQHQREIQNYAIADGILWNFTAQRTEKIPLAVLDIPATRKANDDRGTEFHLPAPGEGQ